MLKISLICLIITHTWKMWSQETKTHVFFLFWYSEYVKNNPDVTPHSDEWFLQSSSVFVFLVIFSQRWSRKQTTQSKCAPSSSQTPTWPTAWRPWGIVGTSAGPPWSDCCPSWVSWAGIPSESWPRSCRAAGSAPAAAGVRRPEDGRELRSGHEGSLSVHFYINILLHTDLHDDRLLKVVHGVRLPLKELLKL